MHGYRHTFTSEPLEELTKMVAESCGGDLDAMVFVSGGSEAVESALKLALQYHTGRGEKAAGASFAAQDVATHRAAELEAAIQELGPENIAAFVFEPVVGAAGGVVPAPERYAALVREICDRYGVLMIADEVTCGSGRCGNFRALEFDGVFQT